MLKLTRDNCTLWYPNWATDCRSVRYSFTVPKTRFHVILPTTVGINLFYSYTWYINIVMYTAVHVFSCTCNAQLLSEFRVGHCCAYKLNNWSSIYTLMIIMQLKITNGYHIDFLYFPCIDDKQYASRSLPWRFFGSRNDNMQDIRPSGTGTLGCTSTSTGQRVSSGGLGRGVGAALAR